MIRFTRVALSVLAFSRGGAAFQSSVALQAARGRRRLLAPSLALAVPPETDDSVAAAPAAADAAGPVLFFINGKSGGGEGSRLRVLLEECVGPAQVHVPHVGQNAPVPNGTLSF